MMKPVILINPNSSRATTDAMVRIARRILPDVAGWTNAKAPAMISGPDALTAAGTQVAAAEMPPDAAGVIVAAFGDPGCADLARRLNVPVIGIGAAAREAASGTFAVVTTTPDLETPIDALMSVRPGYLGCHFTAGDPLSLLRDADALDLALIGAAKSAAKAGAQSVIIGGGPLAEAATRIADACPVPLIQPLPEACLRLQRWQLRPAHPAPPAADGFR